jgi:predicted secreted hydrolase
MIDYLKPMLRFFRLPRLVWLCLMLMAGGSGSAAVPLELGVPTKPMVLPQDLAAHEWALREWWSYTGRLQDAAGKSYGFELIFFRRRTDQDKVGLVPLKWFGRTAYLAHFAVVEESSGSYHYYSFATFDNQKGHADTARYEVAVKELTAAGDDQAQQIHALGDSAELKLDLKPQKPAALHGRGGIVAKGGGLANYYLSYPRLQAAGTLVFEKKKLQVSGLVWLDHEYGYLSSEPGRGWEIYRLQLDNQTDYLFYRIYNGKGEEVPESFACRMGPEGEEDCVALSQVKLEATSKWRSPHTGARYPSLWQIRVPAWNLDVEVKPRVADQEFFILDYGYWEGSCAVRGKPANGRAYIELVGYSYGIPMDVIKNW